MLGAAAFKVSSIAAAPAAAKGLSEKPLATLAIFAGGTALLLGLGRLPALFFMVFSSAIAVRSGEGARCVLPLSRKCNPALPPPLYTPSFSMCSVSPDDTFRAVYRKTRGES